MTTVHTEATDRQLLDAFVERGDQTAFAAVMERHGVMAFRAARNALRDHHAG